MAAKSPSTSPDGLTCMPTIIRVIAPAFSERNGASWGGAERNAAEQIAVMYSARDGPSVVFAATAVAIAIKLAAAATELRRNRERAIRTIVGSFLTRGTSLGSVSRDASARAGFTIGSLRCAPSAARG